MPTRNRVFRSQRFKKLALKSQFFKSLTPKSLFVELRIDIENG